MESSTAFRDLCSVKDTIAAITELEQRLLEKTGLNLNQAFALCCLAKGSKSAGELAAELRISGPSLSRILRRLLWLGFIYREPSLPDARVRELFLSEAGNRKVLEIQREEEGLFPWEVKLTPAPNPS